VRRVIVAGLLFIGIASFAALAVPQEPTFKAMMTQMPQQQRIEITARSMQRDSAGTHATGNVQVRITPIHPDESRTVIHADEVIYHGDTGEIETRGDAHVMMEKVR
jgi:lipopolysaccharide assembly outer membrane protein LptD (OstA)